MKCSCCQIFAVLISLVAVATGNAAELTANGVQFFESKIRPVLVQRCYSCHSASAKEVKGGLLLDTRDGIRKGGESGAAVVPGKVEESLLIEAIKHETFEMPPGDMLPDDAIAAFEEWIEMGAPDPRTVSPKKWRKISLADARSFWSFKRPALKPPGTVKDAGWAQSEIDRYLLAKLEEKGLMPVGDADRRTLIRRVTFDLTGLPPTPDEIEVFASPDASQTLAGVVDRLLASRRFGERWGRHWLDVARYGESTGKERNVVYPYAWRYRDYVIDSFNSDKPFDRFMREQVAGDLLPAKTTAERNENLTATGFLAIGTKSLNERNREQYAMDVADEQIDVTTRAFLGFTVACARCHDHKFDPIATTDYYAMAGIFRSTEVLAGVKPGNKKTGYDGEFMMLAEGQGKPRLTADQVKELGRIGDELQQARDNLKQANAALALGVGKYKLQRRQKLERSQVRLQARIKTLEAELKQVHNNPGAGTEPVMAVREADKPANSRVNNRGDVKDLGPEVQRGIPIVLSLDRSAKFHTPQSGRMQLAAWLASRDNPLTARVMVNRIWCHLFGAPLVDPVDNFGALGEPPTHPELLDYLAIRFMEQGWSVKTLIREIVLSHAYQLSSAHDDANFAIDADNHYLWRMNRRRLEAEAIRDAILAASGRLETARPETSLAQSLAGTELGRRRKGALNLAEGNCRSVYLPLFRGRVPEVLSVFDMADPSLVVGRREVTTVATQALFMMNSPLVANSANATARRVLYDTSTDAHRLNRMFLYTLNRLPTDSERQRSLAYLQEVERLAADEQAASQGGRLAAWASLCQTLFAAAEFRYVY